MPRFPDKVEIITDAGAFNKFQACRITNDITAPTEATFTIGDDGAVRELESIIAPGQPFEVRLNDKPRMKGRAEVNMFEGSEGINVELTVRTRLSDARYSSADPRVKVEDTSIEEFILALYKSVGFTKADFTFGAFAAANLMTGKAASGDFVNLEEIKVDQAKVNPPETIYGAAERHLKRFGATQWDGPDGKIIIGRPDDTQEPITRLICTRKGSGQGNNCLRFKWIKDWSELTRQVSVYGATPGRDIFKSPHRGVAIDPDVDAVTIATGTFDRLAIMVSQQAKTQAQADRIAKRELSARARRKDAFEISVDGWTYWNGRESIPWANNTVTDLDIEMLGGNQGRYLIVRTDLEFSVDNGLMVNLTMVAPGIWVI